MNYKINRIGTFVAIHGILHAPASITTEPNPSTKLGKIIELKCG